MSERRIVITGMGWVTPLGTSLEEVWARLLRGESGIGQVTRFDASTFVTNFAAQSPTIDLAAYVDDPSPFADVALNSRFALAAASMAIRQSGLRAGSIPRPQRAGMYLGSGEGQHDFPAYAAMQTAGWNDQTRAIEPGVWPETAYRLMNAEREHEQEPNVALSHLAHAFGFRGPSYNCMTACAASTQAIGEAFELLRRGDADLMLAGGSHSMIHPLGMTGFIRLTAMSKRSDSPKTAARPFDKNRDGFVMGEGAGMLVLEDLEHAKKRGATPLAEIVGFGSSADAFRITDIQPDGRGAQAAMRQALKQAGIDPREPGPDGRPQIHYISAHGTGTQENDSIETTAVKAVFGPLAPKIPFSSVKSMFGHLIQAAGAVELMTCVMAIKTGIVPPTMNLTTPDPRCDLDYVPNAARDLNPSGGVEVCLSNSFGFGGQNDTVIVRRFMA